MLYFVVFAISLGFLDISQCKEYQHNMMSKALGCELLRAVALDQDLARLEMQK